MIDLLSRPWAKRAGRFLGRNTRWAEISALFDRQPANLEEEVRVIIGSGWVDELVVRGHNNGELLAVVVEAARAAGRRVRWVSADAAPALPEVRTGERWFRDEDAEMTSWVLLPPRRSGLQLFVKRVIDVVASALMLAVLAPVFLAVGLAIKLTSTGPVFYRWRVLGENGRPFVGYKFRTMVRNADQLKPELLHLNERNGPVFKIASDPRITPVGRWLRRHSIDELPQFWSVLKGDMSLVGPRPVFPSEYRDFEIWQMRKLSVKPGMTCLWQIVDRKSFSDFANWIRLDLQYVDTWSLMTDVQVLWQTPMAVLKGTGY